MEVPAPDRPARVMQQEPEFIEVVRKIRNIVETLEGTK